MIKLKEDSKYRVKVDAFTVEHIIEYMDNRAMDSFMFAVDYEKTWTFTDIDTFRIADVILMAEDKSKGLHPYLFLLIFEIAED